IIMSDLNPVNLIFYLPALALFTLFTTGFVYTFSVVGIYVSDLSNILLFSLRLLWLATPIFYSLPSKSFLALINTFNPFFYFLEFSRRLLIHQSFETGIFLILAIISISSFCCGKFIY